MHKSGMCVCERECVCVSVRKRERASGRVESVDSMRVE